VGDQVRGFFAAEKIDDVSKFAKLDSIKDAIKVEMQKEKQVGDRHIALGLCLCLLVRVAWRSVCVLPVCSITDH